MDVRRTVATSMARLGVAGEVVAAVLNHAPAGVTRRVYNRYDFLPEKADALRRWTDHLERIVSGETNRRAEVVRITDARPVRQGRP